MKKLITYGLAVTLLAGSLPSRSYSAEIPRSQLIASAKTYNTLDDKLIVANDLQPKPSSSWRSEPKPQGKHWYQWFYKTWLGRATTVVIIAGIAYGVSASGKKDDKKTDDSTPPVIPPTPPPPPPSGDDKNPKQ